MTTLKMTAFALCACAMMAGSAKAACCQSLSSSMGNKTAAVATDCGCMNGAPCSCGENCGCTGCKG